MPRRLAKVSPMYLPSERLPSLVSREHVALRPGDEALRPGIQKTRLVWMGAWHEQPSSLRVLHIFSNKDSSFLSILLELQERRILQCVQ